MDLQGGSANLLQGGYGGFNIQGSRYNPQASPSSGLSVQPAASGFVLNQSGTRLGGAAPAADPGNTGDNGYGGNNTAAHAAAAPAVIYPDKSGDIQVNQAGLTAQDLARTTGLATVDKAYGDFNSSYNTDVNAATDSYNNESHANQSDLQGNKQTALENAVQGRQGLYGTLASLGALSGTGLDLANHAVQKGANEDLTTAADTYANNQSGLDNSYGTYKRNEQHLKDKADTAYANNKTQVNNEYYKGQQQYLKNIADDYTAEGKHAEAQSYIDRVSALFPQISSTAVPTIDMGYTGASYTAPTLQSYASAANNTSVAARPAQANSSALAVPGLIALNKRQG